MPGQPGGEAGPGRSGALAPGGSELILGSGRQLLLIEFNSPVIEDGLTN